jgi:hypothetical protein
MLKRVAKVANGGCGFGASTIIMVKAYPTSIFTDFDYQKPSILTARKRAKEAGPRNVTFIHSGDVHRPIPSRNTTSSPTSIVCMTLAQNGTCMVVEPFANDRVEDNLNPVDRAFYAASTMICVPASLSYKGPALGAQARGGAAARCDHERRAPTIPLRAADVVQSGVGSQTVSRYDS